MGADWYYFESYFFKNALVLEIKENTFTQEILHFIENRNKLLTDIENEIKEIMIKFNFKNLILLKSQLAHDGAILYDKSKIILYNTFYHSSIDCCGPYYIEDVNIKIKIKNLDTEIYNSKYIKSLGDKNVMFVSDINYNYYYEKYSNFKDSHLSKDTKLLEDEEFDEIPIFIELLKETQ